MSTDNPGPCECFCDCEKDTSHKNANLLCIDCMLDTHGPHDETICACWCDCTNDYPLEADGICMDCGEQTHDLRGPYPEKTAVRDSRRRERTDAAEAARARGENPDDF